MVLVAVAKDWEKSQRRFSRRVTRSVCSISPVVVVVFSQAVAMFSGCLSQHNALMRHHTLAADSLTVLINGLF